MTAFTPEQLEQVKPDWSVRQIIEFGKEPLSIDTDADGEEVIDSDSEEIEETDSQDASAYMTAPELETGRTHQIRVHLSHHEYPIVNDPLYGHPSKHFLKMGLWANEITFKDPLTNKKHRIQDIPNKDYSFFE